MSLLLGSAWVPRHWPSAVVGLSAKTQSINLAGRYTYGWERRYFIPCGSSERWWVTTQPDSLATVLREEIKRLRPQPDSVPWEGTVYARFRGDTTGRGQYGHLDKYPRQFVVREILELRAIARDDCR